MFMCCAIPRWWGRGAGRGESAYGMSGSPCGEVMRLRDSDAARSEEKEGTKGGRERESWVSRMSARMLWLCGKSRLSMLSTLIGQRPAASPLGRNPDRLLLGQNHEVHTNKHKLHLLYYAVQSHGYKGRFLTCCFHWNMLKRSFWKFIYLFISYSSAINSYFWVTDFVKVSIINVTIIIIIKRSNAFILKTVPKYINSYIFLFNLLIKNK